MKRVHSSKQLMHLFCNMTNADLEGFRTSSRNIYFEGGILYSYGAHYPMARKLGVGTGANYREIVLINAKKSSVTTQKHKSQLWSSTKPSQWVFHVSNILEPKAPENTEHLLDDIAEAIDAVLRGISYWSVDEVTRRVSRYNQFAFAFNLKPFSLDTDFYTDLALLSKETEIRSEVRSKARHKRQELERQANKAKWAKEVELWYSCKNTVSISSAYFGLDYDPIRVNGTIVESPRGAQVALSEATVFAKALKRGLIQVGCEVGPFTVEEIDAKFITIGCHKLNIEQALQAVGV